MELGDDGAHAERSPGPRGRRVVWYWQRHRGGRGKAGATVVIAARRLERLTTLAGSVAGQLFPVRCDVRNADDCRRLVQQNVSVAGGLDDVVYAAAVSDMAAVKETSADEWRRILDTNVVGFSLVFAAAEAHLRQATGSLIVLSSISVLRPKPGLVPYAGVRRRFTSWWRGCGPRTPT